MMKKKHFSECIVCSQSSVEQFLDLGHTALANKFLAKDELSSPEPKYPLIIGFCHTCKHVQLTEKVPPAAMFEDYLYISSASDTLKAHFHDLSDLIVAQYSLGAKDMIIDIGCNDGTLLHEFRRHGVKTLGVDPAENLARLIDGTEIERFIGFFNSKTARHIVSKWGKAAVITATNTFPHIQELQDFVQGIQTTLIEGGVFIIEMHYLVDLLDQGAFDTIYHEHISYWALGPMKYLFEQNGMQVVHVERLPLHHGQLRVYVQRKGEGSVQPTVSEMLAMEQSLGINQFETYKDFAQKAQEIKQNLQRTITKLRGQGKRVVGYGAPAKASTLLEFLNIGPKLIDYIVDRSSLKQGRYTPGLHIPIMAPERLLEDQPDYVLLLAWNFVDEILQQQAEYHKRGGKFIIPVPTVQVL